MITATCHCGNIKLVASELPATLTRCNCSVCHRLGALWAYYTTDKVEVVHTIEAATGYCWGDEYLVFNHCPRCGCATHYTVTDRYREAYNKDRVALNFRMVDTQLLASIPVTDFDGAAL